MTHFVITTARYLLVLLLIAGPLDSPVVLFSLVALGSFSLVVLLLSRSSFRSKSSSMAGGIRSFIGAVPGESGAVT